MWDYLEVPMGQRPIPSYQVYKGTVFELVDQAVVLC